MLCRIYNKGRLEKPPAAVVATASGAVVRKPMVGINAAVSSPPEQKLVVGAAGQVGGAPVFPDLAVYYDRPSDLMCGCTPTRVAWSRVTAGPVNPAAKINCIPKSECNLAASRLHLGPSPWLAPPLLSPPPSFASTPRHHGGTALLSSTSGSESCPCRGSGLPSFLDSWPFAFLRASLVAAGLVFHATGPPHPICRSRPSFPH
ncbi:hypothetical protein E2562_026899 [Oryza meyeriana var. granulata]|uniref:NAC domain-containing protein n=1 Tax=Oryza meyeriana var. granulata TaxID=110450 RepID=A0A6G1EPP4_9ORYZ|nr:hypothetical protein E2562_026899 [Oryza meyeriana var. granulata]